MILTLALPCLFACRSVPYWLNPQKTRYSNAFSNTTHAIWRAQSSGLHPGTVNESTTFILLVITDLLYIWVCIYIYILLTSTNQYSKGEDSILWKDNFPIHPFELTKSSGINKAEVLQTLKGECSKRMQWYSSYEFYIYITYVYIYIYIYMYVSYTHIHIHIKKRKNITAWQDVGKFEILPPESPDLLACILGYLRTVSKRGGKRKKRHLTKTKAWIEHVLEEQYKHFTRAKKWFTES